MNQNKGLIVVTGLGSAVVLLATGYVLAKVFSNPQPSFASTATLILVGLAGFVGIMNLMTISSHWMGLTNTTAPFGLPDGTVRAILTIAFIVLVAVFASALLTQGARQPFSDKAISVQDSLSQADANALASRLAPDGLATVLPSNENGKFQVSLRPRQDFQLANDIAKQILTILSTILAAMIGFYFGAKPGADAPPGDNPAERAELFAAFSKALAAAPSIASLHAALDGKAADPAKAGAAQPLKTQLTSAEGKINAANDALKDIGQRIANVRAAQKEGLQAIATLPALEKQIANL